MSTIIAAYAGTGKTYFSSLYPQNVIDFVCMPYKYHLNKNAFYDESSKANFDNILHVDWPFNYFSEIKKLLQLNKIILIPSEFSILKLLKNSEIPYYLCYPQRDSKDEYYERYTKRGNNEDFLNIFIGRWDDFMDYFENDSFGKHIVLQSNQYLCDVIDVSSFICEKKQFDFINF